MLRWTRMLRVVMTITALVMVLDGAPVLDATPVYAQRKPPQKTKDPSQPVQGAERQPTDENELRYWLQNMVWYHHFNLAEMQAATGLEKPQLKAALKRFDISPETRPAPAADDSLVVVPFPGGRHPRLDFRDGAIRPQRETKFSVFLPWDRSAYIVVDLPEALWSNLGLTYLAHTHIDTVWTRQGIQLPVQEWKRGSEGQLDLTRKLPNGIQYTARVRPRGDHVWMDLTLTNGTAETLSDLRVQNCIMLWKAKGFNAQTNDNKVLQKPYAVCRSEDGRRWIITAWTPCHRPWANPPCPCLHSDPKFPDCQPGQTQRVVGWLSFYEGDDLQAELKRIEELGWQDWELK